MFAEFSDVMDVMAGWIKQKTYEAVSIALNTDGSIRHVGVLGGVPPAVPGLGDWVFADTSYTAGTLTAPAFAFHDKSYISFTKEKEMDPEKKIESLEQKLEAAEKEIAELKASAEEGAKASADVAAQFAAEQKAHTELKAQIEAERVAYADAADAAFVDGLCKQGRLRPADKSIVAFNLKALRGHGAVEFSLDDGKKEKMEPLAAYRKSLESAPALKTGEQFSAGEAHDDATTDAVEKLSRAHMEKNPGVTYSQASMHVLAVNPQFNKIKE
jgi:nucleotide-binding universal stress UspA family protein